MVRDVIVEGLLFGACLRVLVVGVLPHDREMFDDLCWDFCVGVGVVELGVF